MRIFYADRFEDGRSYTTFLDLDRRDLSQVIYAHREPILPFGAPETFDDDGVMRSFVLRRDGKVWLYYSGWNRRDGALSASRSGSLMDSLRHPAESRQPITIDSTRWPIALERDGLKWIPVQTPVTL